MACLLQTTLSVFSDYTRYHLYMGQLIRGKFKRLVENIENAV